MYIIKAACRILGPGGEGQNEKFQNSRRWGAMVYMRVSKQFILTRGAFPLPPPLCRCLMMFACLSSVSSCLHVSVLFSAPLNL